MNTLLAALTETQVDQLIKMLHDLLLMFREAVQTVWIALAPFLVGYLVIRQRENRKALDENTKVSKEAFEVANGHNHKIETLTRQIAENPREVVVVNPPESPVPIHETH